MRELAVACQEIINRAEEIINSQRVHLEDLMAVSVAQDDLIAAQTVDLKEYEKDRQTWFNKTILIGVLGFIAGGAITTMYAR